MKTPQDKTDSARHWAQLTLLAFSAVVAIAFQNCGQGSAFELSETLSFKNGQGYGGVLPPDVLAPDANTDPSAPNGSGTSLSYFSSEACADGNAQTEIRVVGSKIELRRDNCQDLSPALLLDLSKVAYSAISREVLVYNGQLLTVNGWQDVIGFCRGGYLMSPTEAMRVDVLVRAAGTGRRVDVREGVTVAGVVEANSIFSASISADSSFKGINLPAGESFRLVNPLAGASVDYHLTLTPRNGGGSPALRSQDVSEMGCFFK